jgi:hypothetical protein
VSDNRGELRWTSVDVDGLLAQVTTGVQACQGCVIVP